MSTRPHSDSGSLFWTPSFPHTPSRWPFFYGWVIVVMGTLGVVASIPGQTMGVGVFTDLLIAELGLTRTQLSAAYMVGTLCSGFLLPWGGTLFDRLGARKMGTLSAVMLGLSLFYMSLTADITGFLRPFVDDALQLAAPLVVITLGFFLIRFWGQGIIAMAGRAMMGKWFNHRRGLVLGIHGVLVSFFFSFAPKGLDTLIQNFSWQGAWQVLAVTEGALIALLCWLFFRDNPEECGLMMDGKEIDVSQQKQNLDLVIHKEYTRKEALRTYSFWMFNLMLSWQALFITAYVFHIEDLGRACGFTKDEILYLFIPAAVISVGFNLVGGYLSQHTRIKYLGATMALGSLLVPVGLMVGNNPLGISLNVLGQGMSGGMFGLLMGLVWPRFFGRQHIGAISGVNMSSTVLASALGPILFSLLKDYTGGYTPALWVAVAFPALLFVLFFKADNPQRKPKP